MKSSTKRIVSILISMALLIAVAVIFVKLIKPSYGDIEKLRGEIQARTTILTNQNKAVAQVQNLIGQLQEQNIFQFQEQISLILPLAENVPQALNQYQAIAQANGLSIQSAGLNYLAIKASTSNINLAKRIAPIRFKLKLLGSYEAIKAFTQAIETNVRLMDLIGFKITRAGQVGQNIYLNEMTVDTYYQTN
jgi:Tfp pilus assembly protein PilO